MKLDLKSKIDILPDKALKEIKKLYNKHASDCATLTKRMIKENINKGLGADNEPLAELEDSTKAIRKVRNIAGKKPLKATGNLYKGIKTKKNLVEIIVAAAGCKSTISLHFSNFFSCYVPPSKYTSLS